MTHPPMALGAGGEGVIWGLGIKYNVQFMLVLAFENMRGEKNVNFTPHCSKCGVHGRSTYTVP